MEFNNKTKHMLRKQLALIEKREKKLLIEKEANIIQEKVNPLVEKVQLIIPPKLKSTMEVAFFKGFALIFEKGVPYIEKTYNKDKLQLEHDINHMAMERRPSRKYMKQMDKSSSRSNFVNSSIAMFEGGLLGFLGIGIPDIPLFLSVLLKSVQEIAISYGYSYEKEEEKIYLLALICGALAKGEEKEYYMNFIDDIGTLNDSKKAFEYTQQEIMEEASDYLAESLLTAKFIQGIPIVGIVGGAINPIIVQKVTIFAKLKYKKRYLKALLQKQS